MLEFEENPKQKIAIFHEWSILTQFCWEQYEKSLNWPKPWLGSFWRWACVRMKYKQDWLWLTAGAKCLQAISTISRHSLGSCKSEIWTRFASFDWLPVQNVSKLSQLWQKRDDFVPTCFSQNDTVFHKTTHKDEIVLGGFRQNDWGLGKKGFANIPDVFHTLQAFEDAFEDAHLFPFLPQRLELHPCKYQIHKKCFFFF